MALAQLVAAVIDNLTLTNWGSHKNKSAFRPLLGYERKCHGHCRTDVWFLI
jgi:hypothetical protein